MDGSAAFYEGITRLAAQIPPGKVTTYGQLALLMGSPQRARMAGRAIANAPAGIPCHRVVNAKGGTAPHWKGQRELLEAEGVSFRENGCVDLKKHMWWG